MGWKRPGYIERGVERDDPRLCAVYCGSAGPSVSDFGDRGSRERGVNCYSVVSGVRAGLLVREAVG